MRNTNLDKCEYYVDFRNWKNPETGEFKRWSYNKTFPNLEMAETCCLEQIKNSQHCILTIMGQDGKIREKRLLGRLGGKMAWKVYNFLSKKKEIILCDR